jgi:hypothetical protein
LESLKITEYFDLSRNNLSQATDWMEMVNKVPFLKVLRLSGCDLSNSSLPSLSFTNSSKSLAVIDLSYNNIASSTFNWLSKFSNSLVDLDVSWNWVDVNRNWDNSSENLDWLSYLSSFSG